MRNSILACWRTSMFSIASLAIDSLSPGTRPAFVRGIDHVPLKSKTVTPGNRPESRRTSRDPPGFGPPGHSDDISGALPRPIACTKAAAPDRCSHLRSGPCSNQGVDSYSKGSCTDVRVRQRRGRRTLCGGGAARGRASKTSDVRQQARIEFASAFTSATSSSTTMTSRRRCEYRGPDWKE